MYCHLLLIWRKIGRWGSTQGEWNDDLKKLNFCQFLVDCWNKKNWCFFNFRNWNPSRKKKWHFFEIDWVQNGAHFYVVIMSQKEKLPKCYLGSFIYWCIKSKTLFRSCIQRRVRVCVCLCLCMCVRVCVVQCRATSHRLCLGMRIICNWGLICMCVRACVCVRQREREMERQREGAREKEKARTVGGEREREAIKRLRTRSAAVRNWRDFGLKHLRTRSCHEWESLVSKFRF